MLFSELECYRRAKSVLFLEVECYRWAKSVLFSKAECYRRTVFGGRML